MDPRYTPRAHAASRVVSLPTCGGIGLDRAALDYGEVTTPLFIAVPTTAYARILSEDIGQQAIARVGINLIVFDPIAEEIVRWIR